MFPLGLNPDLVIEESTVLTFNLIFKLYFVHSSIIFILKNTTIGQFEHQFHASSLHTKVLDKLKCHSRTFSQCLWDRKSGPLIPNKEHPNIVTRWQLLHATGKMAHGHTIGDSHFRWIFFEGHLTLACGGAESELDTQKPLGLWVARWPPILSGPAFFSSSFLWWTWWTRLPQRENVFHHHFRPDHWQI